MWGAWIEIVVNLACWAVKAVSHPVWGAWIEMAATYSASFLVGVAPRVGCVD